MGAPVKKMRSGAASCTQELDINCTPVEGSAPLGHARSCKWDTLSFPDHMVKS